MSMDDQAGRGGFTIAEVLVAILITGLVSGIIFASYMGAIRIVYSSQKEMERTALARLMLDRVSDDLACAFLRAGREWLVFVGEEGRDGGPGADSVTFITASRARPGREVRESELSEVSYRLDPDGRLMRREDTTLDEDPFSGGSERAIGEGLAGIEFEYLGDDGWVPSWDSRTHDQLPRAARVTLVMETEEGGEGEAARRAVFRTEAVVPAGGDWEEKPTPTPTPLAGGPATPTPRPR